jgi:transcriptional regulator with XRE-family HTH domain
MIAVPPTTPHPEIRRALAAAVRELRAREKLSQEALSLAAGLNRGFVNELESADRGVGFEAVVSIADAMNVSLVELAGRVEDARRRADRSSRGSRA